MQRWKGESLQSNPQASALLENLVSAVFLLDETLHISYANPAAEQLLAQSIKRLSGLRFDQLLEHTSLNFELIQKTLHSGHGFTDNEVTLVIDGQAILVELTATPFYQSGLVYALVEMRQIDQQKKISQEIYQHAQQQAAKELVRGLAHEIKNPLGGLRGAAQLLEKQLPSAELKEFTEIIIEQADRLRNLVDRLLGPQSFGQQEIHNIHSVLEKVRRLVELTKGDNIKIKVDYDPSIPDFEMQQEQMQQAFLNILQNAVQALVNTAQAEIKISTRTVFQVTIHGQRFRLAAEIRIIDNGPGIPNELKDTLFYPMVTGREGGTGLGLSIAQNLINQHKGRIECNSWPSHTEFIIQLPLRK